MSDLFMVCGSGVRVCGVLALISGLGPGMYSSDTPVVHGLWPEVGPWGDSECVAPLSNATSTVASCLMPDLQEHEFRKHSACAGVADAAAYYDATCALAEAPLRVMTTVREAGGLLPAMADALEAAGFPVYDSGLYEQVILSACQDGDGVWRLASVDDFPATCGEKAFQLVEAFKLVEQVHIALGLNETEMVVSWASCSGEVGVVEYSREQDFEFTAHSERIEKYSVRGDATGSNLDYESPFLHHARLTGLSPSTTYFYRIGGNVSSFVTAPSRGEGYPLSLALLGDHGQTNFSEVTVEELSKHEPKSVCCLLLGDLSYSDGDGARWDSWARMAEPVFSKLPLMVIAGNHEVEFEPESNGRAFKGYRARHTMPGLKEIYAEGGRFTIDYDADLTYEFGASYYSCDVGRVHVIMLNVYAHSEAGSIQRAWLERDLACLNRSITPWVIVATHAPWYHTSLVHRPEIELATKRQKASLEPILAGVSLVFSGHVHAYERSKPVRFGHVDDSGPTYITIGDGGNREKLYNEWMPHSTADWSDFHNGTRYGFGTLTFHNDTVATWRWLPNLENISSETDVLVVRNNFRPTPPSDADDCAADALASIMARAEATARRRRAAPQRPTTHTATLLLAILVLAFCTLLGLAALKLKIDNSRRTHFLLDNRNVELEALRTDDDPWSSVNNDAEDEERLGLAPSRTEFTML